MDAPPNFYMPQTQWIEGFATRNAILDGVFHAEFVRSMARAFRELLTAGEAQRQWKMEIWTFEQLASIARSSVNYPFPCPDDNDRIVERKLTQQQQSNPISSLASDLAVSSTFSQAHGSSQPHPTALPNRSVPFTGPGFNSAFSQQAYGSSQQPTSVLPNPSIQPTSTRFNSSVSQQSYGSSLPSSQLMPQQQTSPQYNAVNVQSGYMPPRPTPAPRIRANILPNSQTGLQPHTQPGQQSFNQHSGLNQHEQ